MGDMIDDLMKAIEREARSGEHQELPPGLKPRYPRLVLALAVAALLLVFAGILAIEIQIDKAYVKALLGE